MITSSRPASALLYGEELEERVQAWAKAKIEPKRLAHVKGVVASADGLARRYAPDEALRARLAGWIHDVAKHWSDDELLDYAESHRLAISESERQTPMLLHGAVGYALAADVFGFDDPKLESACRNHTTGAPDMNTLDKIVFLADLIEPMRDFPGVDAIRADAERNLDAAVLRAVDHTLLYLIRKQALIDPRALVLRNRLLESGARYGK